MFSDRIDKTSRCTFAIALTIFIGLMMLDGSLSRLFAQTSPTSYAPGVEGEIWQQLPAFGRGIDSTEKPLSFALPSISDPTGNVWPCINDLIAPYTHCYPSGTFGIGAAVFPSDTQLFGARFTPCVGTGASVQCYASGRIGVGPAVGYPVGYGPCTYVNQLGTQCYPSGVVNSGPTVPPSPTEINGPLSIAVDSTSGVGTIYVGDYWSNRLTLFDFFGNAIHLAHPIGNGAQGVGPYTQTLYGGPNQTLPTTVTGELLNGPENIKVDASRQILVSDSGNGRIAVFGLDGSLIDQLVLPPSIDANGVLLLKPQPTGLGITPGASFRGASNPPNSRIVVTDKYNYGLYIFDATSLSPVASRGGAVGSPVVNGGAGIGATLAPGDFLTLEGATMDNGGHIYAADYDRNRVQIFDLSGNSLGSIGEAPASGPVPNYALLAPTDVMVDHRGLVNNVARVIVTDTYNQRLAVYAVDFTTGTPVSTLLFSLNAAGDLNGNPSGIAEDTSHDPVGKLVTTDAGNNRVQRFQVPDLAVVNAVPNGSTQTVTFDVAVAAGKDPIGVKVVTPIVCATSANTTITSGALAPQTTCATARSLTPTATLLPGKSVAYSFTFANTANVSSFDIFATGNPDALNLNIPATLSNHKIVTVTTPCPACTITPTVVVPGGAIETLTAPVSGSILYTGARIYTTAVTLRLTATSPIGLSEVDFQFIQGPESGVGAPQAGLHTVAASGLSATVDVQFTLNETSIVEYWGKNIDGTEIVHGRAQLTIDLVPPTITYFFNLATSSNGKTAPNAAGWWNAAVTVPFNYGNAHVTTIAPTTTLASPLVFATGAGAQPGEGRNRFFTVTVADRAGLTATKASNDLSAGGAVVNIDVKAPVFVTTPTITLERASFAGAPPPTANAAVLLALATDPALADATAGSGVKSVAPVVATANFAVGTATVLFVATDVADNQSTASVTVKVVDTVPPVLSCPATLTVSPGVLGTLFSSQPGYTVSDASMLGAPTGTTVVTVTQSSLATLVLVVNQVLNVTLTATDPAGLKATCTTVVSAKLSGPPHFTRVPPAQTIEGSVNMVVDLNATAVDAANATLTVTSNKPATFPLGPTMVTFTATDAANQTVTATTVITVVDTTAPTIAACAAPVTIYTPGTSALSLPTMTGTVSATDFSTFVVTQSPVAGTSYSLGTNTTLVVPVTITVTDNAPAHNASTCATSVTYKKATTPPVLTQANITGVYASTASGAVVNFAPTVVDAVDGTNTDAVTCTPKASGSVFPIGTTTVTCSATDTAGLSGSVTFTVTVAHSAPVCTAAVADPAILWSPNHKLTTINIKGVTNADGALVTTNVTSIFQDEPTSGFGDGDTAIDGFILNGVAQVRAERSGLGNGRVYYLTFTSTTAGGSCTGTVTVSVPHDQAHPAVGDGPKYDSTKTSSASGDKCHGETDHGHHDGDGCIQNHHGHYDGDNCQGHSGYHHDGDGDRGDRNHNGDDGHRSGDDGRRSGDDGRRSGDDGHRSGDDGRRGGDDGRRW